MTPFSARALDRGFAGALVALARHARSGADAVRVGAEQIDDVPARPRDCMLRARTSVERVNAANRRRGRARGADRSSVQSRVVDLLDSWRKIYDDYADARRLSCSTRRYELDRTEAAAARDARRRTGSRCTSASSASTDRCATSSPSVNLFLNGAERQVGGGRRMSQRGHGQIRRSQVITTWGAGALIDLPRQSGDRRRTRDLAEASASSRRSSTPGSRRS